MALEPTNDQYRTSDPASWADWLKCVQNTLDGMPLPGFPSAQAQADRICRAKVGPAEIRARSREGCRVGRVAAVVSGPIPSVQTLVDLVDGAATDG